VTAGAATASYRLVQEALTNAVKHAGPQATVTVTIATAPDGTVVAVDDDGGHARCRRAVPGAGVGLRGIRERVHAVGGSFEAGPSEGGFRVRARFRADDGPA
jgi:signal transduction histidine kinase